MGRKIIGAVIISAVVTVATVYMLNKQTPEVVNVVDADFVTVNGKNINRKMLIEEMRFRGAITPGVLKDSEAIKSIMDEIVITEVMAQKAIENGLDKSPKIAMTIKKLLANEYRNSVIKPQLKQLIIAKQEIEEAYEENIGKYSTPAMAKAAVIFMQYPRGDIKNKPELLKEITKIKEAAEKQPKSIVGFGALAKKNSDDMRTKYRGGVLNWVSKGTMIQRLDKEIVSAIFEVKTLGEISPIIETRRGLALVKLLEERAPKSKSLNVVENTIRNQLLEHKKQQFLTEFYDDLKGEADIENHSKVVGLLLKEQERQSKNKNEMSLTSPPMFPIN